MTATEAQVAAAMEALGCGQRGAPFATGAPHGAQVCSEHHRAMIVFGGTVSGTIAVWTNRGCPVAVAVADAVVAAGPDPAKVAAEAMVWRDRGQIIHDQQTRIAQLERECLDREATETDARSQLATTQANCTCRSAT